MNRFDIASAADVARVEAGPYERFMAHASVHAALAATAARVPGHTALVFVQSDDLAQPALAWSYAEFLAEVRAAANLFARLADGEEPRVALLLPAIPQAHFALWGAETAGIACPLNYLLNVDHLAELVQAAGCNILVALGATGELDIWPKAELLRQRCPGLRQVLSVGLPGHADDFDALCAAERGDALAMPRAVTAGTVAALFHTGGTTGLPKLAQHTHGNQLHSAWGAALMYGTTEADRIVNGFPVFHVAGSLVYGLSTLLAGGTVIQPTLLGMRNRGFMQRYWAFAARERATLVTATPTGIATLMSAPVGSADISAVRALLTGGAPLPNELAQAFENDFGIPVRNTLGMTESAGVIAIEPVSGPRVPGSCGLRLPYMQVEIAPLAEPARGAALAAPGASGILRARGPNVSPGYTDRGRDPGTFEAGWLVSGDIAHLDEDGRLFVTGRAKDVIIRNSHNVDPGLIEDALLKHPGVEFAAAVGAPDAYAGEVPVAYVVAKAGATLLPEELLRFVELHIHERPAFPKHIEQVAALPQTAVGKVYKPTLRLMAIERVIGECLAQAGLGGTVSARGEEGPRGLGLCFLASSRALAGAGLHEALAGLMRPFAIAYRIEAADDAQARP